MMPSQDWTDDASAAIPLGPRLARADRFKRLFADGMHLVEEAAGYLDGPGRQEVRSLSPALADAYSAEGMRLTARLMQIASWLLMRRAVIDGQAGAAAIAMRMKVPVTAQPRATALTTFLQLPLTLQRLTERSLRLQRRVILLDRMVGGAVDDSTDVPPQAVADQMSMLQRAFAPLA